MVCVIGQNHLTLNFLSVPLVLFGILHYCDGLNLGTGISPDCYLLTNTEYSCRYKHVPCYGDNTCTTSGRTCKTIGYGIYACQEDAPENGPCNPNPCGDFSCDDSKGLAICQCPNGKKGFACDIDCTSASDTSPSCSNNGDCCDGQSCLDNRCTERTGPCNPWPCGDDGAQCLFASGSYKCVCKTKSGQNCEIACKDPTSTLDLSCPDWTHEACCTGYDCGGNVPGSHMCRPT
ncbi:unnamed protein product [Owenia fusiformis]|uniref:Uncharacterized protein n=1 Tax=Owenia fusiformis TaxID=6347 RepID=A0A8J1U6L0_OWEFU|nr:unnamed protein product [Owenia fusiformis]